MEHAPRIRIDDLLAHAGWANELAAALVSDPATRDDLVQETWLAALKHPPRDEGSPRAWLARVMTNLARNRRRDALRREVREQAGARQEAQPAADATLQALEAQRVLV